MSFVGSSAENTTDGSPIKGDGSTVPGFVSRNDDQNGTEHVFSPPLPSRSDFVITRKKLIHNSIDESKKPSLKPSPKNGIGYVKTESRSKTPPPRRNISSQPRYNTPQPRRNSRQPIHQNFYPINWNNQQNQGFYIWEIVCLRTCLEPDEWIKDSGCSKHMTGNKSLFSTYKAYDGGNIVFRSNLKGKIIGKEPKDVKEALKDKSWVVAMQEELNQFVANDVWELVPLPINQSVITTKWVFINILDENGIVSRNKARLVAHKYNQQEGIDYDETYALVARLESIRIILAIACANDFKLYQMDIRSAFPNGFINEEVYVAQPPVFIDFQKPNYVYKLKKALYGLTQAPKAWYDRLKAFLIKHEYSMGMVDNILFSKKSKSHLIIVKIYVDDIIFGSTSQNLCDDFAKIMHDEFEIVDPTSID
ncbi:retrovirus-related pol polyprotein from transposon TNT 1-94 [Tanacetum coccineum]